LRRCEFLPAGKDISPNIRCFSLQPKSEKIEGFEKGQDLNLIVVV
jgi:hypothetical protein